MSKSDMLPSRSSMPSPSGEVDEQREELRELIGDLVMAGPGGARDLHRCGLLGQIVPLEAIVSALEQAGHVDQRRRALTGEVTTMVLLNLALHSGEGYDSVLARTFAGLPGALSPAEAVPAGPALSYARDRLAEDVMRVLFERTAAAGVPGPAADRLFGLEVTAFDGTSVDLSGRGSVGTEFTVPSGGRYPKARVVTLTTCATRKIRAAAMDSYAVAEQPLTDRLAGTLGPDMLNLADRNFFSMARFVAFSARGAQLIWRVKNGAKSIPAKIKRTLPDGSHLVVLRESAGMLTRRRKACGDRLLPRLEDTIARLVEFDLVITDARGRRRTSRMRLLTTLLDPEAFPATQIAAAYAQRWQAEIAYLRIKSTLRGDDIVLRGQTPKLARQEIWALLIVYNALCDLATRVAALEGIDPDEVSFIAVVRLTRSHLAADLCCRACGHRPSGTDQAIDALTRAIAAHPRNRIDRNRVGPRTTAQRRAQRGTTATYTIEITESNLPKEA